MFLCVHACVCACVRECVRVSERHKRKRDPKWWTWRQWEPRWPARSLVSCQREFKMVDVAMSHQGLVIGCDHVMLEQTIAEQCLSTKNVPLITVWFGKSWTLIFQILCRCYHDTHVWCYSKVINGSFCASTWTNARVYVWVSREGERGREGERANARSVGGRNSRGETILAFLSLSGWWTNTQARNHLPLILQRNTAYCLLTRQQS